MLTYLYVALGGALGSAGRFAVASTVARATDELFPWGTLVCNVTGCFAIGLIAVLTGPGGRVPLSPDWRLFFTVGVCGGYTTFSSFSLQTMVLARDGDLPRAAANVLVSVLFCLVGVWLGATAGAALNGARGA